MAGARDSCSAIERGAISVGFDHVAQAHAPIYTPCLVGFLARTKPRDVEGCERRVEGFARRHVLQDRAGRHGPWQLGRGQHVAPPYRNGIEVQGARYGLNRAVHHPTRDRHRGPHWGGAALVGQHDPHVEGIVGDAIRTGQAQDHLAVAAQSGTQGASI